jgi:hypothetical protein
MEILWLVLQAPPFPITGEESTITLLNVLNICFFVRRPTPEDGTIHNYNKQFATFSFNKKKLIAVQKTQQ